MENQALLKQMDAITKNQNVVLPADDARAFMNDMVSRAITLPKLGKHFATSDHGEINALDIAPRQTKRHLGLATAVDTSDKLSARAVEFTVKNLYLDLWLERDTIYYTAQSRGQDIDQVVAEMLQQRFAADIQDLAFNGDESSTDNFIKMNDGFLKLAKAAATGARNVEGEVTVENLRLMVESIPAEELAVGDYKYELSKKSHLKLQAEVAARPTALGDATMINGRLEALHGFGFEIVDHITTDEVIFTPFENLVVVLGSQVNLNRVGDGVEPTIKQAIMYFLKSGVDFIIRTPKALAYLGPVTP